MSRAAISPLEHPFKLFADPFAFRDACAAARSAGKTVAFVPTMGALHAGHLSLVTRAREEARSDPFIAVSIFVNPTQFGPREDLARYPRDLARDVAMLEPVGVNAVFAPTPDSMYHANDATRVIVSGVSAALEGEFRPGHFEGVATVVAKLLALAGPCVAVFGKKDFQQLAVIRALVRDLFLPVRVVGADTLREPDGVAMSSRNAYLSSEERIRARSLSRALDVAHRAYEAGERNVGRLESLAKEELLPHVDSVDYARLADAGTLAPLPTDTDLRDEAVLALACHVGKTRLIDNATFGSKEEA